MEKHIDGVLLEKQKPNSFIKDLGVFQATDTNHVIEGTIGIVVEKLEEEYICEIGGYKFYQKHIDEFLQMKDFFNKPFSLTTFKKEYNNLANLLFIRTGRDQQYRKRLDPVIISSVLGELVYKYAENDVERVNYSILLTMLSENKTNNVIVLDKEYSFLDFPMVDFSSNDNFTNSIKDLAINDYETFSKLTFSINRMPKILYSYFIELLKGEDFISYYSKHAIDMRLHYAQDKTQIESKIRTIKILFYRLIEFSDFKKANALLKYLEKYDKIKFEELSLLLEKKINDNKQVSINGLAEMNALEKLFVEDYDEGIKYFHNSKRKPSNVMLCFLKYSKNEDFDDFVNSKDNLFSYLKGIYKNEELSNNYIRKFLSTGNNAKAIKFARAFKRDDGIITKENETGLLVAEKNIENLGNDAFDFLLKNLEENKQKILLIPSETDSLEDLENHFIELYSFVNKNSTGKKVFTNVLERFVTFLKLNSNIESEILSIIRLYTKVNVIFTSGNLGLNKENISDLNKIGEQSNDFYLTITDLQQKFPSLYSVFRTDIFSEDNDFKWEIFVKKMNLFIDEYGKNHLNNHEKIKEHISQLLLRTFTERQEVYKGELELLRKSEDDIGLDDKYKKYYTFNNKKISVRTRQLYFLLEVDYSLGVEKFSSLNKSNSVIFLFLKLAKSEDIKLHEKKILNYYSKIFSNRFVQNEEETNQTSKMIHGKLNSEFESGYENISISSVYDTLINAGVSNNLLNGFEKILTDSGIELEKIDIDKKNGVLEGTDDKLCELEKNQDGDIKEDILEAFINKQFYKIDALLKKM